MQACTGASNRVCIVCCCGLRADWYRAKTRAERKVNSRPIRLYQSDCKPDRYISAIVWCGSHLPSRHTKIVYAAVASCRSFDFATRVRAACSYCRASPLESCVQPGMLVISKRATPLLLLTSRVVFTTDGWMFFVEQASSRSILAVGLACFRRVDKPGGKGKGQPKYEARVFDLSLLSQVRPSFLPSPSSNILYFFFYLPLQTSLFLSFFPILFPPPLPTLKETMHYRLLDSQNPNIHFCL